MRNTLLKNLQDEMREKLQVGTSNYDIGVTDIYRGLYQFDNVPSKPSICFTCYQDEIVKAFAGSQTRQLSLLVCGFTTNNDDLHTLAKDTEYFFMNDYSQTTLTVVGDIAFGEGIENEEDVGSLA